MLFYPGCRRRDPARPESNIPRSAGARGDGAIRADRRQSAGHVDCYRAVPAGGPILPTRFRTVRLQGASIYAVLLRTPAGRKQKTP